METLNLVTLDGTTVGSFAIKGCNEVIVTLDGDISIDTLLDRAQRTSKTVGLRFFTPTEEDE